MTLKQYIAFLALLWLLAFSISSMWRFSLIQLTKIIELQIAVEKLNNKSCE